MIAPRYRIRLDWGGGGPHNIWVAPFASDQALVDGIVTGRVQRKLDDSTRFCEGVLDLVVNDVWPGKYNVKNADSPVAGQIKPGVGCFAEVSFDDGATWDQIFGGWLDDVESAPDYGSNEARLHIKDTYLHERPITIASTGPTTINDALALIHDTIGWTGGVSFNSDRRIADFSANNISAKEAIAALTKVDLGAYYISRDFVATYVDAWEYARRTSKATVIPYGLSVPGVSTSTIKNIAQATKTVPSAGVITFESTPTVTFEVDTTDPAKPVVRAAVLATAGGANIPVQNNGNAVGSQPALDFDDSGDIDYVVTDDPAGARVIISGMVKTVDGGSA